MMEESMSQECLENNIENLKSTVKKYSVDSILEFISVELCSTYAGKDIFSTTGLTSPYKQYLYLAGIRLSIVGDKKPLDDIGIDNIKKELEIISNYYNQLFFIPPKNKSEFGEWRRAREISMPLFLDYFNSDVLNYEEQEIERIKSWFGNFDSFFEGKYNLTTQMLIDIWNTIVDWLRTKQREASKRISKIHSEVMKSRNSFIKNAEAGMSIEEAINLEKSKLSFSESDLYIDFYIPVQLLYDKFDKTAIDNFLDIFCITEQVRDFRYYTQENPFAKSPIWRCSKDLIVCPIYKQLLHAIFKFLYIDLENSQYRNNFFHHRDIVAEKQTGILLASLFPSKAEVYSSVYETADSHNEHDLLILYKKNVIIVEVKAGKLREPFRNPDKAYKRIEGDFNSKSGIQKAYDQALKLKKYIASNECATLYDRAGNEIKKINNNHDLKYFLFCITTENYGLLGTQLSILLDKPNDESYPWACNIYDLENIIRTFKSKHYNWRNFLEYIKIRMEFHERFYAFDELEICGAFLTGSIKNYIEKIKKEGMEVIAFSPDMSNVFDDIYFRDKGLNLPYQYANNKYWLNKKCKKNKYDKRKIQKISRKKNRR